METFYLPSKLRSELRTIWGIAIFGKEKEVIKKYKEFIKRKKFKRIITVGDYCSLTLPSDVKIFDGKVNRKKVKKLLPFSLKCFNPPGTIQAEVWPTIKQAMKKNENIFVEGEEDLLVIPAVLLSEENSAVVYGFFDKGVCLIQINSEIKQTFKELLGRFKTK